jgi:hypothetical protein
VEEPKSQQSQDRPDPRQWRIDGLPQTGYRARWSMHLTIVAGLIILGLWLLIGRLTGVWGVGLALAPIGGFLVAWGVIQEILAILSMETFRRKGSKGE